MTLEMGNNFSYFKKKTNTLSSFCTFHRCFILHTRMFAAEHLHAFKQSVCFQEAGSREVLSGGDSEFSRLLGSRDGTGCSTMSRFKKHQLESSAEALAV